MRIATNCGRSEQADVEARPARAVAKCIGGASARSRHAPDASGSNRKSESYAPCRRDHETKPRIATMRRASRQADVDSRPASGAIRLRGVAVEPRRGVRALSRARCCWVRSGCSGEAAGLALRFEARSGRPGTRQACTSLQEGQHHAKAAGAGSGLQARDEEERARASSSAVDLHQGRRCSCGMTITVAEVE